MNFDAWQTVWVCVGTTVLFMAVDGFLANRAGLGKIEMARKGQRSNRMARMGKGTSQ